ncbi:hypothetical protein BST81_13810 [Leptolyngbya sp. 'hensonii']|nr:hypothetical protein BST81_13810 [Leptolyngbya sp. 'hensonii']
MRYLGYFETGNFPHTMRHWLYQRSNGAIQVLSNSVIFTATYPSWEEAKKHIPTDARINMDRKPLESWQSLGA